MSSAAADLELKLKSLADQLAEVSEQEREAKKRVGDREDGSVLNPRYPILGSTFAVAYPT